MNTSKNALSPSLTDNQRISKGASGRRVKQINRTVPCLSFFLAPCMKPILEDFAVQITQEHTRAKVTQVLLFVSKLLN